MTIFWANQEEVEVHMYNPSSPNHVDSNEEVKGELVAHLVLCAVGLSAISISEGLIWCYMRFLFSKNPDVDISMTTAIIVGICFAFASCGTVYAGCRVVHYTSLLVLDHLPEVALKAYQRNYIAFTAAFCFCSLVLSAIFLWQLNEVTKILIRKYDPLHWLIYSASYSIAFTTFLSVAIAACMGIVIQIIRMSRMHAMETIPILDCPV